MVDRYPWLWFGVVLLMAAVHVGNVIGNVRAGKPFGWFDVVAAVTFVAMAAWIVSRQRARRSAG
jgi:hypothetical protein